MNISLTKEIMIVIQVSKSEPERQDEPERPFN